MSTGYQHQQWLALLEKQLSDSLRGLRTRGKSRARRVGWQIRRIVEMLA
jgi:hypothetical protein